MHNNLPKDISDRIQKASSGLGESLTKEKGRTVFKEIKTHKPITLNFEAPHSAKKANDKRTAEKATNLVLSQKLA